MTTAFVKSVKVVLPVIALLVSGFASKVSAQTIDACSYTNSKVTVVASESKTNIVVTNFPKQTRIVIFDSEDNLISIVSTNKTGSANITLSTSVTSTIYVKTLNGEILTSNKAENNNNNSTDNFAAKNTDASNKA